MTEGVGPKLYTNKPKKAQLQKHQSPSPSSVSSPSSMASKPSSSFPTPPPEPPKESFIRRYKFVWPLLLAAVGGYVFMRTTKKKDASVEGGVPAVTSSTSATASSSVVESSTAPVIVEPLKLREPIPEAQQRELFKWILEEKRKVKTKDPAEKKRIDEEKAIIKQFLRAKTIPPL